MNVVSELLIVIEMPIVTTLKGHFSVAAVKVTPATDATAKVGLRLPMHITVLSVVCVFIQMFSFK